MAASSTRSSLSGTAYTKVADGAVSGVVQHLGGHSMARIFIGTSAPADATTDYLLIGTRGEMFRSFAWNGFTTGDQIYVRSDSDTSAVTITTAKSS